MIASPYWVVVLIEGKAFLCVEMWIKGEDVMSFGYLKYYAEVDKYLLREAVSIDLEEGKIINVKIDVSKETKPFYAMLIEFTLKDVTSLGEAKEITETYLTNLIIDLSVKYGMYVGEYHLIGSNIDGEGTADLSSQVAVRRPMDDVLGDGEVEDFKNLLKQSKGQSEINQDITAKNLFRQALVSTDVKSKYMLLYLTLLYSTRNNRGIENQNNVDRFIVDFEGEEQAEYKDGPRVGKDGQRIKETIYTKLRNQIGHYRDVDVESTEADMKKTIDSLVNIARHAVLN